MTAPAEKKAKRGGRSRARTHDRPLRLIVKVDPDAPPVDLPSLRALLARLAVEAWRRDRATARGPDDVENEDDEEDERQDVAPAA